MVLLALALCAGPGAGSFARAADDFSGADRLRALYSAEFSFTGDGVPIVPVAIAEGLQTVRLRSDGPLRLLPDGEGGPEILADSEWQVRASKTQAATMQYWATVWRGKPGEGRKATAVMDDWKKRGETARIFEHGTLFAVSGKVLDRREILVGVGPFKQYEDADGAHARLIKRGPLNVRGVHTELVERPAGLLEVVGARTGTRVRNDGVLWFASADEATTQVEGAAPGQASASIGSYLGKIYVTMGRDGRLAVVNALPADRFLAGLVPAETFPGASMEALKAQAVAARGHLLSKIGRRHIGDPFRLCARTHCQVYSGAGKEHPRTTAAVKATRGELLFTADGGDLVDTVYSANCGGHSEDAHQVWPSMDSAPELLGHFDGPGAPVSPAKSEDAVRDFILNPPRTWDGIASIGAGDRFRWTVTQSVAALEKLFAGDQLGKITRFTVLSRGVSGRAMNLEVQGTRGRKQIEGELAIRRALGGLRSSMFVVDMAPDGSATFRGGGYGHGAGMCQSGAIGMAEANKSHAEILRHYYSGSVLKKLW